LTPGPVGDLPLLIGGGGEKRTLKYTAQFADAHNTFGPPDVYARKMQVLDEWCEKIGRDPAEIERTVAIDTTPEQMGWVDDLVGAGATHLIVMMGTPFDLDPALELQARLR
jgi:alkanesulfonate monooxygenase SsuD/methylene tetrahydromethanopterin reductase-like flavin-dependent oxidoreductase (luciferase family)